MAVERLTEQNHNVEEQMRQREARPNNHGEEQEDTSAKLRDREWLEGNNALSKQ